MQQAVNHLTDVLTSKQIENLVSRLNRKSTDRLPAMWELMILDAISNIGTIQHELSLSNGRCPDISLLFQDEMGNNHSVIADVMTISDEGNKNKNQIKAFTHELHRLASKYGFSSANFHYYIRGDRQGARGKERVNLLLPPIGQLEVVMRRELGPWIRARQNSPQETAEISVEAAGTSFDVAFHPRPIWGGGGYPSFTLAASRSKNTLFSRLEVKCGQLRGAPSDSLRLVVICDGGSDLIRNAETTGHYRNYNTIDVIQDIYRQHKSIDFVLLFWIKTNWQPFQITRNRRLCSRLIVPYSDYQSPRITSNAIAMLQKICTQLHANLPTPLQAPETAAWHCQNRDLGPIMLGAFHRSFGQVKISSRALHHLLAGKVSSDEFHAAYPVVREERGSSGLTALV